MSSELGPDSQSRIRAKAFFQSGNDAALKSNLDYAIQMYREACKLDPANVQFRQVMRGVERKKYDDDPSKVSRLVAARLLPIRASIKTAKARGQWSHVLESCEDAFIHHPWDAGASRDASEAAEELGFKELSVWMLEAVAAQATDADFFQQMAHAYEINNNFPKAIECWERVKKLNPRNESVTRQINALAAKATIVRSGMEAAIHKRKEAAAKPQEQAAEVEEQRQAQLTPEERLLHQIEGQPTLVGLYLELADLYRGKRQLEDAERVLARGLKAVPGDPTLVAAHADVQIARLQHARKAWAKKCHDQPDDEVAKAKLEQVTAKLNEYEIKEYARRAALYPENMNYQYELGLRQARAGQQRDAIASFQQARTDPELRVKSLLQAGLSFEAVGALKLADRHYQDALKAADPTDLETINSLHYRLGRVAEAQGDTQMAEEHYNEVAANDYGYLDVAQRLRNLH